MIFKHCFIPLLLIYSIFNDSTACENWASYKDEWCYKILDDIFRTFSEAESSCAKLEGNPSLPTIKTKEEQDFLSNYLFRTSKKVENFWIGAKFSNSSNKFQWIDSTNVSFTNWDAKCPRNKVDYCIQMQGDEAMSGKWIDEPCETKKNLVVCQKLQTWSLARLQKTLLEARKELTDSQEEARKTLLDAKKELTDSLNDARTHIKNLEQNPVPIGFIYVQLPNQLEPKSIWSSVGWSQVTSNYAGQFFRAEGGTSATFGTIQEGDSPRLTNVEVVWHPQALTNAITITTGQWSPFVYTGGPGKDLDHNALKFLNSNVEVRSRNQAVRIWKRID